MCTKEQILSQAPVVTLERLTFSRRVFLKMCGILGIGLVVSAINMVVSPTETASAAGFEDHHDLLSAPLGFDVDASPKSLFPKAKAALQTRYGRDVVGNIATRLGAKNPNSLLHALTTKFVPAKTLDIFGLFKHKLDGSVELKVPRAHTGRNLTELNVSSIVDISVTRNHSKKSTDTADTQAFQTQLNRLKQAAIKAISLNRRSIDDQDMTLLLSLFPGTRTFIDLHLPMGISMEIYNHETANDTEIINVMNPETLAELINTLYATDTGKKIIKSNLFYDNLSDDAVISLMFSGKLAVNAAHDILALRSDKRGSAKLVMALDGCQAFEANGKRFSALFTDEELGVMTKETTRRILFESDNSVKADTDTEFDAIGWVDFLKSQGAEKTARILYFAQLHGTSDSRATCSRYVISELAKDPNNFAFIRNLETFSWNDFHSLSAKNPNEFSAAFKVWSAIYTGIDNQELFKKIGIKAPVLPANSSSSLNSGRNYKTDGEKLHLCFLDIKSSDMLRLLTNLHTTDTGNNNTLSQSVVDILSGLENKDTNTDKYADSYNAIATYLTSYVKSDKTVGAILSKILADYETVPVMLFNHMNLPRTLSYIDTVNDNNTTLYRAIWKPIQWYLENYNEPFGKDSKFFNFVKNLWKNSPTDSQTGKAVIPRSLIVINNREQLKHLFELTAKPKSFEGTEGETVQKALLKIFAQYTKGNIVISELPQNMTMQMLDANGKMINAEDVLKFKNLTTTYEIRFEEFNPENGGQSKVLIKRRDGKKISLADMGPLNDSFQRLIQHLTGFRDLMVPTPRGTGLTMTSQGHELKFQDLMDGKPTYTNITPLMLLQAGFVTDPGTLGVLMHMEFARTRGKGMRVKEGDYRLNIYEKVGAIYGAGVIKRDNTLLLNGLTNDYDVLAYIQSPDGNWWMKVKPRDQDKTYYAKVSESFSTFE